MLLLFMMLIGTVDVRDVVKELVIPEVLILHGPDRPLSRLGVELKLERLVVADLLLVGRHVHS